MIFLDYKKLVLAYDERFLCGLWESLTVRPLLVVVQIELKMRGERGVMNASPNGSLNYVVV